MISAHEASVMVAEHKRINNRLDELIKAAAARGKTHIYVEVSAEEAEVLRSLGFKISDPNTISWR